MAKKITVIEYLNSKGFGNEQAARLTRKVTAFVKIAYGSNYTPPTNKQKEPLFEPRYLDFALKAICDFSI